MKKHLIILFCLFMTVFLLTCCAENDSKVGKEDYKTKPAKFEVDSVSENADVQQTKEMTDVVLYFSDSEALYLHPEIRSVEVSDNMYVAVLRELGKGPEEPELFPTISGDFSINSVVLNDGVCTVDFGNDFVINNIGGSTKEMFAISSVTATLCELEGVECVKINIDGDIDAEFGHGFLDSVFYPNHDLIKKIEK